MTIVTSDLLGKPFEYGGRGPETYDCWGLHMELQRRLGVEVPDYRSPSDWWEIAEMMDGEMHLWTECEERPLATILMKMAQHPHHVGLYLGMGRFIHTYEGAHGVKIDQCRNWKRNIVGFYEFTGS